MAAIVGTVFDLGIPYRLVDSLSLENGSNVAIEAGTQFIVAANKVIEVDRGKVTVYPTDYEKYLYMKLKSRDDSSPFAVLTRNMAKREVKAEKRGMSVA